MHHLHDGNYIHGRSDSLHGHQAIGRTIAHEIREVTSHIYLARLVDPDDPRHLTKVVADRKHVGLDEVGDNVPDVKMMERTPNRTN